MRTWASKYPFPETNIDITPLKDAWETITILLVFGIRGKFLGVRHELSLDDITFLGF